MHTAKVNLQGTFHKKLEMEMTPKGTAIQVIEFKTTEGATLFPKLHNKDILKLSSFSEGDEIDVEIWIKPNKNVKFGHHLIIKDLKKA